MDILLRLFLRVILVPLGMIVAVIAATGVAALANGTKFMAMVAADPTGASEHAITMLIGALLVGFVMSVAVVAMLLPGVIPVVVSEAFAIRSWIFHALGGGLSIWVGWATMTEFRRQYEIYDDPKIVIAAGFAAGFAYWAVAGWSAGFWKPVFRRPEPPAAAAAPVTPAETGR
jgi:hypothetical protein